MKHFYKDLKPAYPGLLKGTVWFSYEKIFEEMVKEAKDGDHFVEIGVWLGRSTAYLAVEIINSGKDIRHDVIDTWAGNGDIELYPPTKGFLEENDFNVLSIFKENMEKGGVLDKINICQKESLKAVKDYKDESIQSVVIDGNHIEVGLDLKAWYPKVKKGGIIGGDDLFYTHYPPNMEDYKGKSIFEYDPPSKQIWSFFEGKILNVVANENGPWWIKK